MVPIPRKRSLADMQKGGTSVPSEYNEADYFREVLQLEGDQTEASFDTNLTQLAEELGIAVSRPATPGGKEQRQNVAHISMSESALTVTTNHARTASTGSRESGSTGITSRSSNEHLRDSLAPRKRPNSRRSLSFSEYEKFLLQAEAQTLKATGFIPPAMPVEPAPSLFSISTKKSYASIKSLRNKFKLRRTRSSKDDLNSCVCCRDDFKKTTALHTLHCGHNYCDSCLRVLISQAATDEAKMPPRCCARPIPGHIVKSVLTKDDQQIFMKSVLQFSTPWEARIFCPNPACGEFIPKRDKIDPKHPFEVICRKCKSRACSTCKRAAHAFGQDCPSDWELEAVLQMGEKSGWRRCYKCRNLVELTQGCSHITCRCKAQFCYICGAVWDPTVGCPNYCSGEEELERRRLEEEARVAELEAEKAAREQAEKLEAAEKTEAEKRTAECEELSDLHARQVNERDRFCAFERKMKWLMWTRHGQAKLDCLDRYSDLQNKMRERHTRTATHLEDRQVGAEMELRATLKQAERSVQIRLRHMEAYCDGLGRSPHGPARVVTERDLRELGQQYNVRDDLDRLHQSKINVMRDKQAKQMEQLLARQEDETEKLATKQDDELEGLEEMFSNEEDGFLKVFNERRERMRKRWLIVEEVERKKLETAMKVRFAPKVPPVWPVTEAKRDEGLESVME